MMLEVLKEEHGTKCAQRTRKEHDALPVKYAYVAPPPCWGRGEGMEDGRDFEESEKFARGVLVVGSYRGPFFCNYHNHK